MNNFNRRLKMTIKRKKMLRKALKIYQSKFPQADQSLIDEKRIWLASQSDATLRYYTRTV